MHYHSHANDGGLGDFEVATNVLAEWTYLDIGEILVTATLGDRCPVVVATLADDVDPSDGEKMAAARELYAALDALLFAIEEDEVPGLGHWVEAARKALAKAGAI